MRGVEITKDFDLGKIKLNLSKQLNEAGRIIREDHIARLERGLGVDGQQMTPLKDSTIEAKGFNQILVETRQMMNLVMKRATKTKQVVEIHPGRKKKYKGTDVTSAEVGLFHQEGSSNLPKREWFGISKNAEARGIRMVELYIDKQLKNA